MPKIAVLAVAQHRAVVQHRLIDAAEEVMRSDEPEKLTAGAVTAATGIACNSIYRYTGSVDDLRGLVLAYHLSVWIDIAAAGLEAVGAPTERIVVWVCANLQQAARTEHDWLMRLSRSITPSPATAKMMDDSRAIMHNSIAQTWVTLAQDPMQLWVAAKLTRGLLEVGLRQLDSGISVDVVVGLGGRAARGLVAGITDGNS